eukprot:scaffold91248_cov20-Tisochrysis_lutea.AAC.1
MSTSKVAGQKGRRAATTAAGCRQAARPAVWTSRVAGPKGRRAAKGKASISSISSSRRSSRGKNRCSSSNMKRLLVHKELPWRRRKRRRRSFFLNV